MRRLIGVLGILLMVGCSPSEGPFPEDGGGAPRDAGSTADASVGEPPRDAGALFDAGTDPDAGIEPDAGGEPDAGNAPDAGQEPDAGGEPDAGNAPDAGLEHDAGTDLDAGTEPDAGEPVVLSVRLIMPGDSHQQDPVEVTYVKAQLRAYLEIGGPQLPDRVDVLVDGLLVTSRTGGINAFDWDTGPFEEGEHALSARAHLGTRSFLSSSRRVVVDRTPPHLALRTPEAGASDVSEDAPIQAVFSEPIVPETLESSVWMTRNFKRITPDRTLSPDGTVLTLKPLPQPSPSYVRTLHYAVDFLYFAPVTDRAGNLLSWRSGEWSWVTTRLIPFEAPLDASGGSSNFDPSLQLDAKGLPTVAWSEGSQSGNSSVYVWRFTGQSWVPVGLPLWASEGWTPARDPSLQLDATDHPVVAWSERSEDGPVCIHVQRWTGETWAKVLTPLCPTNGDAYGPSLRLDAEDQPVVAWEEGGGSLPQGIRVARWTEAGWASLGEPLSAEAGDTDAIWASLQLAADGTPFVAWTEYTDDTAAPPGPRRVHVRRWSGDSWEPVGGPLDALDGETSAGKASLALDAQANPVVAWAEYQPEGGLVSRLYVRRWTGTTWEPLGGALGTQEPATHLRNTTLRLDASGNPVVAWDEDGPGMVSDVYLQRWTGSSWSAPVRVSSATRGALHPSFQLDAQGQVTIAWGEFADLPTGTPQIVNFVRRLP
ncbi:Ig-like domain-containing protein [Corallococcus sp. BB11-1]|uniref:Ig-like domain-containing protein n=1 Tax=Corallococcus sp. BB11-1 TaxID=2996783 RepID=UPI00226E1CA2|nr:Ig-like domain-containing protein [Corallococcus sp. BB11-1]MCY1032715.1 Ig-like domain-containing protein [Corallococcus sp. BB11-1]